MYPRYSSCLRLSASCSTGIRPFCSEISGSAWSFFSSTDYSLSWASGLSAEKARWRPRRTPCSCQVLHLRMELIHPLVQVYAEKYSPQDDNTLNEILSASASHPEAHMLSGALQGKFLEMISLLLRPKYILEIGTFLGYSALCLAAGLCEGGELHTLENDENSARVAAENFKKTKTGNKIILHRGNA